MFATGARSNQSRTAPNFIDVFDPTPVGDRDGEVEGARENGEGSDGVTGFGWSRNLSSGSRVPAPRARARPGLSTSRKAWSVNRVVFRDGVAHYGATVEVRRTDSPVCEEK